MKTVIDYTEFDNVMAELFASLDNDQPLPGDELPITELREPIDVSGVTLDQVPPATDSDETLKVFEQRQQISEQAILEHVEAEDNRPLKVKIESWFTSLSISQWIKYGMIGTVALSGVFYLYSLQNRNVDVSTIAPKIWDEKSYFTANSPLSLTQAIKGQASTDVYKQALIDKIMSWDVYINESLTKNLKGAIDKESVRLSLEAKKEVDSGVLVVTDRSQQVFDMTQCAAQTLQPVKCVLLRYAVEGLDKILKGDASNDADLIASGWMRYRASMRALAGGEMSIFNTTFTFVGTGIDSQIKAIRELLTIAPQAPIRTQPVQIVPSTSVDKNLGIQPVEAQAVEAQ